MAHPRPDDLQFARKRRSATAVTSHDTTPPAARPPADTPHLDVLRMLEDVLPVGTPVTAELMNACIDAHQRRTSRGPAVICTPCATAADAGIRHNCTDPGCTCQHRKPADAEIRSYYGPTAWDSHAGSLWHYDCPDTVGAGHDGQVTEDDDGTYCSGCRTFSAAER